MPSELITRSQVQKLLDRSRTTVKRYEASGLLRAGIDAHGVHWFERAAVLRLRRRMRRTEEAAEVVLSGDEGARVARALGCAWPCSPRVLAAAAEALAAASATARLEPAARPRGATRGS